MRKKAFFIIIVAAFLITPGLAGAQTPVEDKVAVLITGWGMTAGFNLHYAWTTSDYPRIGDKTEFIDQPCKIGHVGEFPYESHIGMIPFGITHYDASLPKLFDHSGIYKWNPATFEFDGAHPSIPSITLADIPGGTPITPLIEVVNSQTGELTWPPDMRTGVLVDHTANWFKIGSFAINFANGVHDMVEQGVPSFVRYYGMMGQPADPADWDLPPSAVAAQDAYFDTLMHDAYGDRVDVRYGYYTAAKDDLDNDLTYMEDDVAEDFSDEGFTKMLLCRETADYNNYALHFMTGNYVKERLCELGTLGSIDVQLSRQVGRTPEFNTMNIRNLRPIIEGYAEGSTIGMIYVTRGLTWGANETSGISGQPHPWSQEVYHDNAYLNYLSWKQALQAEFGDRYDLVFTKEGVRSDLREDNFYTYGLGNDIDLQGHGGETVFMGIREAIQLAKQDGLGNLIVAPCHWNYDNLDNIFRMQEINNMAIAPLAQLEAGVFGHTYCEDAADNDTDCAAPEKVVEINVAPSYSHVAEEFGTAYYVVVRGALEHYGIFPAGEEPTIETSQLVTKLAGGTVDAPLLGASIVIPGDPHPTWPEGFTPETAVAVNGPHDTNDCLWEDTVITIGAPAATPAMGTAVSVGPAIYFGPYRTFFNRDVTVTIPYNSSSVPGGQVVYAYIYNHVTDDWDPIAPDVRGSDFISFRTQVLGLFMAGAGNPPLPTLVELSELSAVAGAGQVVIAWSTAAEIDNAGFNLYRAAKPDGEYVQVNAGLIPAQGSPSQGADYSYLDSGLRNRQTYFYQLEDIDADGATTVHGPVKATPRLILGR